MSIRCFSLMVEFWGAAGPDQNRAAAAPQKSTHKESDQIDLKLSGPIVYMPTKIKILSGIIHQSFQEVIQDLARGSRIPDPKFCRREILNNSEKVWFRQPSF